MFWIVAVPVLVLVGVIYWWAGRHSSVRRNVRGLGIDEALKNDEASSTFLRHKAGGGPIFPA